MKKLLLLLLLLPSLVFGGSIWSGSGFFINDSGSIATAAHMVKDAAVLKVLYHNKVYVARLVAVDYQHDVAIIKIDEKETPQFDLQLAKAFGQKIYILGYPLPEQLGMDLKLSAGIITHPRADSDGRFVLKGLACGGNSGGPIVDEENSAVGVLVAGLALPGIHCSTITFGSDIKYVVHLAVLSGTPTIYKIRYVGVISTQDQIMRSAVLNESIVYIQGND